MHKTPVNVLHQLQNKISSQRRYEQKSKYKAKQNSKSKSEQFTHGI